jgi:hypothetical protein
MPSIGFSDAVLAIAGTKISVFFSFVTLVEGSATMGAKNKMPLLFCSRGYAYAMLSVTFTSSLDTVIEEITLLRYFLVSKALVVSSILMILLQSLLRSFSLIVFCVATNLSISALIFFFC